MSVLPSGLRLQLRRRAATLWADPDRRRALMLSVVLHLLLLLLLGWLLVQPEREPQETFLVIDIGLPAESAEVLEAATTDAPAPQAAEPLVADPDVGEPQARQAPQEQSSAPQPFPDTLEATPPRPLPPSEAQPQPQTVEAQVAPAPTSPAAVASAAETAATAERPEPTPEVSPPSPAVASAPLPSAAVPIPAAQPPAATADPPSLPFAEVTASVLPEIDEVVLEPRPAVQAIRIPRPAATADLLQAQAVAPTPTVQIAPRQEIPRPSAAVEVATAEPVPQPPVEVRVVPSQAVPAPRVEVAVSRPELVPLPDARAAVAPAVEVPVPEVEAVLPVPVPVPAPAATASVAAAEAVPMPETQASVAAAVAVVPPVEVDVRAAAEVPVPQVEVVVPIPVPVPAPAATAAVGAADAVPTPEVRASVAAAEAVPMPEAQASVAAAVAVVPPVEVDVSPAVEVPAPEVVAVVPVPVAVPAPAATAAVAPAEAIPPLPLEVTVAPAVEIPTPQPAAAVVAAAPIPRPAAAASVAPPVSVPQPATRAIVAPATELPLPGVATSVAAGRSVTAVPQVTVAAARPVPQPQLRADLQNTATLPGAPENAAGPEGASSVASNRSENRIVGGNAPRSGQPDVQQGAETGNLGLAAGPDGSPEPTGASVQAQAPFRQDLDRPLAVMIDNLWGYPQQGILQASYVVEMPVEGGLTRLMTVFDRVDPGPVGPVRSARDYFHEIAVSMDGILVHDGGSPAAMAAIERSDLPTFNAFTSGQLFSRAGERNAPYNLYTHGTDLRAAVSRLDLSQIRSIGGMVFRPEPEQREVGEVEVRFSRDYSSGFRYLQNLDQYRWIRRGEEAVEASGEPVYVDAVLVASITARPIPDDPEGRLYIPLRGGPATLYLRGRAVEGSWLKEEGVSFVTAQGEPVDLTPFKTWLLFAPDYEARTER